MDGETPSVLACYCLELRTVDPVVWEAPDSDLGDIDVEFDNEALVVKDFFVKF